MKAKRTRPWILWLAAAYLGLPLAATLLFAVADKWGQTALPESYTLRWLQHLITEPRFLVDLGHSLFVSLLTVLLMLVTVVPATAVIMLYRPAWVRWLDVLAVIPFALPGVVLAVGIIQLYAQGPIQLQGTPWILVLANFVLCLPYMYKPVWASLHALDGRTLVQAAESLGAEPRTALRYVILPNIAPGMLTGSLLTFSIAFGEFVLANILAGGQYPTMQVFLRQVMQSDGHLASMMVILYFVVTSLISIAMLRISRRPRRRVKEELLDELLAD